MIKSRHDRIKEKRRKNIITEARNLKAKDIPELQKKHLLLKKILLLDVKIVLLKIETTKRGGESGYNLIQSMTNKGIQLLQKHFEIYTNKLQQINYELKQSNTEQSKITKESKRKQYGINYQNFNLDNNGKKFILSRGGESKKNELLNIQKRQAVAVIKEFTHNVKKYIREFEHFEKQKKIIYFYEYLLNNENYDSETVDNININITNKLSKLWRKIKTEPPKKDYFHYIGRFSAFSNDKTEEPPNYKTDHTIPESSILLENYVTDIKPDIETLVSNQQSTDQTEMLKKINFIKRNIEILISYYTENTQYIKFTIKDDTDNFFKIKNNKIIISEKYSVKTDKPDKPDDAHDKPDNPDDAPDDAPDDVSDDAPDAPDKPNDATVRKTVVNSSKLVSNGKISSLRNKIKKMGKNIGLKKIGFKKFGLKKFGLNLFNGGRKKYIKNKKKKKTRKKKIYKTKKRRKKKKYKTKKRRKTKKKNK